MQYSIELAPTSVALLRGFGPRRLLCSPTSRSQRLFPAVRDPAIRNREVRDLTVRAACRAARAASLFPFVFLLVLTLLLAPSTGRASDWVYSVVPGDNLWDFSEKYLDNVTRFEALRKMNNIERPRRMRPGSQILVPMEWITSNSVPALIATVTGEATLVRRTGETLSLRGGEEARLGDRLSTGSDSSVAVRFADDTILTLHASSEMRFDHLSAHGETGMVDSRLNLLEGRLDTRVTPAAGPGSRFEIHTPAAVSAVRGTEYRASATAVSANIEVIEGSVEVEGAGEQALLPEGFGTRVEQGSPPLPPRELLPAPQLSVLPAPIESIGFPLRWSPVAGATRYRIEIAATAAYESILWDQLTDSEQVNLPDLADASYHLRLRAIDELGLEGREDKAVLALNARPQPPLALTPGVAEVVREERVELAWSASSEAVSYQLEVADTPDFRGGSVRRHRIAGNGFTLRTPGRSGIYYWRVASVADDGEVGPAGTVRSFERRPAHSALATSVQDRGNAQLLATWDRAAPGLRYEVQIASDPGFQSMLVRTTLDEPELALSRTGRSRYLRVRSVEADGYAGPWGATQRLPTQERDLTLLGVMYSLMFILVL